MRSKLLLWTIAGFAVILPATNSAAQKPGQTEQSVPGTASGSVAGQGLQSSNKSSQDETQSKPVKAHDKHRAASLYLSGSKLFEEKKFEPALHDYEQAAALDPTNSDYTRAAQIARSHAVTALIQSAAIARTQGDGSVALAALQHALELDPNNAQVLEHLRGLADDSLLGQSKPIYQEGAESMGEAPQLEPATGVRNFHLRTDRRQLIQMVYKAYGIDATLDQSVSATTVRFDMDNATFNQAVEALDLITKTFEVPLDPHRVLSAADTNQNRQLFQRQTMETVYVPGMTAAEITELSNIAKNVFAARQVSVQPTSGTLTLRAPPKTLDAFNTTMQDLVNGRSQVMLEVRIIQLAHSNQRNTGVQLPQQITAFNVYTEEQAILNANQALVQQIIASGLAAPGDTLAILGILIASGAVPSSIFSNGFALFGGGLTLSGLSFAPATINFALNSSDSRELDSIQLRLADGEEQTLLSGTRYPIQTSSYSSLFTSNINIPGLTAAGTSSGLSSLASTLSTQNFQIPQVQYQDLGLTLKATPKVMRSGDVALTLDLKLTALAGTFVNGNPVLNNRSYSGVVTLKEGAIAVLASELNQQESLALTGTPGLTELPGFDNVTGKNVEKDYSTLLIVLTPHLVRGMQPPGHTPMLLVPRGNQAQ